MAGSVAIVTGAGTGIGRAVVARLVGRDHAVLAVGRRREKLEETAGEIGGDVRVHVADMGDEDDARGVVDAALEAWGRCDVLVNNAAAGPYAPLVDADRATLEHTFAVNVYGPIHAITQVLPHMIDRGGGRIVNVSSMATIDPFPGLGVYAATKAAIESVSRSLKNEYDEHGIRAFSIAPGAVETPMLRGLFDETVISRDQTLDPDDVAAVIEACACGERDDESGAVIVVASPS